MSASASAKSPAAKRERKAPRPETWRLRLYIAGNTARCASALANLQRTSSTSIESRSSTC